MMSRSSTPCVDDLAQAVNSDPAPVDKYFGVTLRAEG
jgi:hypothetical protein